MAKGKGKTGLKWEYKMEGISTFPDYREFKTGELNQLGYQGWEAVGVFCDVNGRVHILLKRPIK